MSARRVTLLLCCVVSLTACGSRASTDASVPLSLPVGELPSSLPAADAPLPSSGSTGPTTTLPRKEQVGARAKGNRVILLGDSVTASTSQRYSNDMCKALVPLGWRAEVDAESGRFIEFGNRVLDARLAAGWDAAVVLLGNNYVKNQDNYRKQLERIVTRLSPNPIVLLTVTEIQASRQEVNAVIRDMAKVHSNVQVVEWAITTRNDPGLTGPDHLHLTASGRIELASSIALALGKAAITTAPAKCLPTNYTDDSMMPVTGTSAPGTAAGTTTSHGGAASTTEVATTVEPPTSKPTATTVTPTTKPTVPAATTTSSTRSSTTPVATTIA
jgi:lysophospholipase L1-like esterase